MLMVTDNGMLRYRDMCGVNMPSGLGECWYRHMKVLDSRILLGNVLDKLDPVASSSSALVAQAAYISE